MDISDINFALKDNEIIATLNEKGGHLYKAVRYYCKSSSNDDPRNKINRVAVKQKFKNRVKVIYCSTVAAGKTEYYYKDNRITVLLTEEGQTLLPRLDWIS